MKLALVVVVQDGKGGKLLLVVDAVVQLVLGALVTMVVASAEAWLAVPMNAAAMIFEGRIVKNLIDKFDEDWLKNCRSRILGAPPIPRQDWRRLGLLICRDAQLSRSFCTQDPKARM